MVFCLCSGRSCFSRTLVITPTKRRQAVSGTPNQGERIYNGAEESHIQWKVRQQLIESAIEADINSKVANSSNTGNITAKLPETPVNSIQARNVHINTEAVSSLEVTNISNQVSVELKTQSDVADIDKEDDVQENVNENKSNLRKNRAPPVPIQTTPVSSQFNHSNHNNVKAGVKWARNDTNRTPSSNGIENGFNSDTTSSIDVNSPRPSLNQDSPKISIDTRNAQQERREGVAPIPVSINTKIKEKLPVFIKDPRDEQLIRKAIESNDFLSKIISGERLKEVIAAMYNKEISANDTIARQGEKGKHMYVSAKGTYQVIVDGKVVSNFKDVRVFGELAILYANKRLATVKAATSGRVWVLDSSVYQQIVVRSNMKNEDEIQNFLYNNEILNVVGKDALQIVATLLKTEYFKTGQTIVRQGDRGDKFYIIRAGTVTITKEGEGVVGVYKKGDCFGELALLEEDSRQATVTANPPMVECLTLSRREFIDHLGEIKNFKYIKVKYPPKASLRSVETEYEDIDIKELRIIKTLGVGGFGRVELVQHTKNENLVFALKYLKKVEVVQQNQQDHVYNEKMIQMKSKSPFIIRLYRTYKDTKYIYFLMESCLGGDLWTLLQKQKNRRFEEKDAKFICACVILAFEYLHSQGIIYRDLKPENLLIAVNGYIKLTDFGFAKKIPQRGKTYTFAGTPEYVAPEIVLNKGHDRSVDYWAFGAFVFEMLSGRTPFRTDDSSHMRTYNKILSGIDTVQFPTYINLKARHLIEKLCRPVPSERIGMQKNGIHDIKAHKWFLGFDWQKMEKLEYPSPFKPKLNGPIDTRHFDNFKRDIDIPPEELSGWDHQF